MDRKIKVPTRAKGEIIKEHKKTKLTKNPIDEMPRGIIWDSGLSLDEQIKRAMESHEKRKEQHKNYELHEVRSIKVYTKYDGKYERIKPIKS